MTAFPAGVQQRPIAELLRDEALLVCLIYLSTPDSEYREDLTGALTAVRPHGAATLEEAA